MSLLMTDLSETSTVHRRPNKIARMLATAIIGAVTAAVVTKVFGRRAGLFAALCTAAAHEFLEVPLAQQLSRFGPLGVDVAPT
jgi:hypothetical protein